MIYLVIDTGPEPTAHISGLAMIIQDKSSELMVYLLSRAWQVACIGSACNISGASSRSLGRWTWSILGCLGLGHRGIPSSALLLVKLATQLLNEILELVKPVHDRDDALIWIPRRFAWCILDCLLVESASPSGDPVRGGKDAGNSRTLAVIARRCFVTSHLSVAVFSC